MKKIRILVILNILFLLLAGCFNPEANAEKNLKKYLREKYGEEFYVSPMSKRRDNHSTWYEAYAVYPESYIGTVKERDSYYWGKGFVTNMKPGDSYGKVLLHESANRFYGKKLEELFGPNYLAVIKIDGGFYDTDFEKHMEVVKAHYKEDPTGNFYPIAGGIYIFGRVESDEDRERYRSEIYKFIQFMKETGTFEYVSLSFKIIDERILSDEYYENDELRNEILSYGTKVAIEEKERLFQNLTESFSKTSQENKLKRIENMNKTNIEKSTISYTGSPSLLYTKIRTKKYIKNNFLTEVEPKDYNNVSDIEFTIEQKMN